MEPKRFYRSTTDRVIGGVAAGLAEYFSLDPVLIRLLFVIFALFGGGGVFDIYHFLDRDPRKAHQPESNPKPTHHGNLTEPAGRGITEFASRPADPDLKKDVPA